MVKYIRCSEIIDVRDGTHDSPKYINDGGYPLITSKNIKDNNIDFVNVNYISLEDYTKINQRSEVVSGDIIMPMIGTIGNPVIVNTNERFAIKNVALFKVSNNEQINSKFFYYVLKSENIINQLNKQKRGGTQNFVSLSNIRELQIPILDIIKQQNIANILDKAQELIDKRKVQIEALDELVKSQFIEMFGDIKNNSKEWTKLKIGDVFEIKTGATPSRKQNEYWEEGTIPWVKTTELKEVVIKDTEEYISEEGFNKSSVNLLPKNTLLIAMYGQGKTRGMTGKLGIQATTNQACAAILPSAKENMDFIWFQLRLSYEDLRELGRGGSQPNLNTNLIKSFRLIFPPMQLQNQFTDFVKQVDKLKFEMENSLKELEDNFNSLMQRVFKGELLK